MTEQNAAPKAVRTRRNPPAPAAELRAEAVRHPAVTLEVANEWRAYLEATPIAAETFLPASFCAALNALVAEVDKP